MGKSSFRGFCSTADLYCSRNLTLISNLYHDLVGLKKLSSSLTPSFHECWLSVAAEPDSPGLNFNSTAGLRSMTLGQWLKHWCLSFHIFLVLCAQASFTSSQGTGWGGMALSTSEESSQCEGTSAWHWVCRDPGNHTAVQDGGSGLPSTEMLQPVPQLWGLQVQEKKNNRTLKEFSDFQSLPLVIEKKAETQQDWDLSNVIQLIHERD